MQGAVESGTCWAPPRHMGHDLAGVSRQSVMLPKWVEIGRHGRRTRHSQQRAWAVAQSPVLSHP
jgi:hypothetical protein